MIGGGKVEELRALLDSITPRPGLVIVDGTLSPVQHRNLEKAWMRKCSTARRSFSKFLAPARKPLKGACRWNWRILNINAPGLFVHGPTLNVNAAAPAFLAGRASGKSNRTAGRWPTKLSALKETGRCKAHATLQRAKRKRAPHPVAALVGYTNAGKSTLFNRLTQSAVKAEDLLFATLDPTMRAIDMPSGLRLILSDTVGFISDLPTELVAAFRATLEEVLEADVIIHVRDIAHEDSGSTASRC